MRGHWLRLAPPLTLAAFLLPVAAGLIGTLLPAFGWLPALGGHRLSLEPWRVLLAWPGIAGTIKVTLVSGLTASVLSLALALAIAAGLHESGRLRRLGGLLAPVLAAPHSALALGFAFLIAPSGWLIRLVSPWATGWTRPPDLGLVNDPGGLALIAGLMLKEVPYLLLMTLAALPLIRVEPDLALARTFGYGPVTAWLKLALPRVYPLIRLPVYAVLAFSLSVVDVALILGPGNPPTLGVLIVRWFTDRDLHLFFPAAAGACLQLIIVAGAIGLWRLSELGIARLGRRWIAAGGRGGAGNLRVAVGTGLAGTLLGLSGLGLAGMAVWSVTAWWRFPQLLPERWTLATWTAQLERVMPPTVTTIAIAVAAVTLALGLVLACLENEQAEGLRPGPRSLWLVYLPLLVPQTAFLFGSQVILIRLSLDGSWLALIWFHLLFVLPYLFLSLADSWRALDPRYVRIALCLGASPARAFLAIKLPMLLRPILVAAAVGFAVSVGLYLPTLFAGAGRFATLTTEAVTLSAGSDRRIIGVYAVIQSLLPMLIYALAIALPAWLFADRRGLRAAG